MSNSREKELMEQILSCYVALSPENLWQDGEATQAQARATEQRLRSELKQLFKQVGRVVTEDEAYSYDRLESKNKN